METLNKSMQNERAVGMLVVGTESQHILIMDPSGTAIQKKVQLPSVPVFIAITGIYEVEYRIVVACRNGNIYTIKKGKVIGTVIELETQPCGLVVIDKTVLVGCMDNVVHSFHFKGKKTYSIYLPHTITNMTLLQMQRIRTVKALVVALATPEGGEVRLYNGKHHVSTFKMPDIVTAMRFGPYGREEASLILCSKSGALTIKILQRQAKLDISSNPPGPPPEQDIPLNVPRKTKLYVEQTQRERDQSIDMHRIFQRDLCKMRLSTARSFVKVITDGQGPLSVGASSLRLDAKVQGLGPLFKLKLSIKNTGNAPLTDIPLTFTYGESAQTTRRFA
jgi:Bardet-Biedl syndrome 1 protein